MTTCKQRWGAAAIGWALAAGVTAVLAQSDWRTTAVPFYTVEQFAQASVRDKLARAEKWQSAAQRLQQQLQQWCTGSGGDRPTAPRLQDDWRAAVAAWDRLDAIELGPLVQRRSARSVDFMPERPAMIERAIRSPPKDAQAMELVGAPAKGFAALEWLLWPQVPVAATPRCEFAQAVAGHLARESQALVAAFDALAQAEPEPEAAQAALSDTLNQWVGGVELLRWAFMRKPLEVAHSRGEPAAFPRMRSGQSAASWAARWSSLRAYAVLGDQPMPSRVDSAQLIPFETWLRSRGTNALADKLVQATVLADRAVAVARPEQPSSVESAADALARLTHLVQTELAPALNVSIGFSDADGD